MLTPNSLTDVDTCGCWMLLGPMSVQGLGRVKTPFPGKSVRSQDRLGLRPIAAISGLGPTMFMTRVRL